MMIITKRIYEKAEESDGIRILVDRLWPRGISKEQADVDIWLKDIAPSTQLRKWFNHDPAKWQEFKKRYGEELKENSEGIKEIEKYIEKGMVTLLFAAKDSQLNNAVVLQEYLESKELK